MKNVYLYFIILFFVFINIEYLSFSQVSDKDTVTLEELLDYSLDELLSIKIIGGVVRDLGLYKTLETDNFNGLDSIIDKPFSIDIITSKTIEARGLKNMIDATENTPGIISGVSPAEPYAFSMRGFSRDYVKILYDGLSIGISSLNTRPIGMNIIDIIEIIKGPVTLSHGQGGAAGTINIISKKPKLTSYHVRKANVSYGQYNSFLANLELTGPIYKKVAYRVSGDWHSSDGWVNNSESKSFNLNSGLIWEITPRIQTTLIFDYLMDELPSNWGIPLIPNSFSKDPIDVVKTDNDLVLDAALRNINYNVKDNVIGSNSYKMMFDVKWDISKGCQNHTKFYYYLADREWKNSENYYFDNVSMGIVRDRFSVEHDRNVQGITSDFKFSGNIFGQKNTFGTHLEFSNNKFSRSVGFLNGIQDTVDIYNPVPGEFGSVDSRDDFFNETTTAVVLDDKFELTSKLSIEAACRTEWLFIERERFNFDGSPRENQSINEHFLLFSYRFGVVYNVLDELNIYGHYSFQHGPFAGDIGTTALSTASAFKPSDIEQIEIGLKSAFFDDKIELAFATYQIKRRIDFQLASNSFTVNEQNSKGLELSAKSSLNKNLKVGVSFVYTDAKFGNYFDANYNIDVTDNIPVNTPDYLFNCWLSYNKIFGLPIELGGGVKYVSERMANTSNTISLAGYTLLNTFAAYNLSKVRFAFHMRNLTNSNYVPWSDIYYPNQYILGAPRTFELSFMIRF